MTWVRGFDFRDAVAGPVDPAWHTYCVGFDNVANHSIYPVNRMAVVFGYNVVPDGESVRNNPSGDPRLYGFHYFQNTDTRDFRVDLPVAGTVQIRGAWGRTAEDFQRITIRDGVAGPVLATISATSPADGLVDAAGNIHASDAAWVANNAAVTVVCATGVLQFHFGDGVTSGHTNPVHLSVTMPDVTGVGSTLTERGFDFRSSLTGLTGNVVDPAHCIPIYQGNVLGDGSDDGNMIYPALMANGLIGGFEAVPIGDRWRDHDDLPSDYRITGFVLTASGDAALYFRVDLPEGPGTYEVRLGSGGPAFSFESRGALFDNVTLLYDQAGAHTEPGYIRDAAGTLMLFTEWAAQNAAVRFTFASGILRMRVGSGAEPPAQPASNLNHLSVKYIPASASGVHQEKARLGSRPATLRRRIRSL